MKRYFSKMRGQGDALPPAPKAAHIAWSFTGGFIATLSGLLYMMNFGVTWWSMALALATAIVLMQITKTVHPPAGSNPLIVMLTGAGWPFLAMPSLLGSIILVGVALIFNNLAKERRYPRYWV